METDKKGILSNEVLIKLCEPVLKAGYSHLSAAFDMPTSVATALAHAAKTIAETMHQTDIEAVRGAKNPYTPCYHQHAKVDWIAYEQARLDILAGMGAPQ